MRRFFKYDDKNYYKIIVLIFLVAVVVTTIFTFSKVEIAIKIIEIVLIVIFGATLLIYFHLGIKFDYKKNTISAFVPAFSQCCKFKMSEISYIELIEIQKPRKKRLPLPYYLFGHNKVYRKYVYRNGKMFTIKITFKSGKEHNIFYELLYKAKSKKRVDKQIEKFNQMIKEFNDYRISNKFFKS